VDAVVVATPAETHAEVAGLVLRAGLPVLVEKPLARTVAEGETLRDASRAAGASLMVGFNRRHWAPVRALTAALREADGAPGVPFRARLVFDTDTSAWAPATQLGDALEDLVSHQLDLLRHLFRREIQWIRAAPGDAGRASVSVRLEGDVEAECRASQRARYREVVVVRRGGSRWLARAGSDRITPAGGPVRAALDVADRARCWLGRRTPALARSFDLQLLAFADFVRRGVRPEPGIEDGLAVLRAVEAARRSGARGGVQERP
jgi:myo-inositol 2-dehydrogenase/D-chiro-inositol 1-dehydrogenase